METPKGRRFNVARRAGEAGDFAIFMNRKRVGSLWNSPKAYPDKPWHVTTRQLAWSGELPPLGLGFDGGPHEKRIDALREFGRIADDVLDWREGKKVKSIYSKTGFYQKSLLME